MRTPGGSLGPDVAALPANQASRQAPRGPDEAAGHDDALDLADLLLAASAVIDAHRRAALDRLGLTPSLARALRVLDVDGGLPMGELACRLRCDASNVTGIVGRLETRGLVTREVARHDRRVKVLVVTREGRAVRRRLGEAFAAPPEPIRRLPSEQRAALAAALRGMLECQEGRS